MILVDVYHEFDKPYEMTLNMVKALKKGGRLVFVEYRKEDPNVPIKLVHKMSVAQVRKEMSIFPLEYKETLEILSGSTSSSSCGRSLSGQRWDRQLAAVHGRSLPAGQAAR